MELLVWLVMATATLAYFIVKGVCLTLWFAIVGLVNVITWMWSKR